MRLGDYLESKRMSAAEFAEQLGVDRSTVSRWLDTSGGKIFRPRWDQLPRIAEVTGGAVTANDFVGEPEDEETATGNGRAA